MRDHGPPRDGIAEVHHREDLAGHAVVEHVLVAADARGRAQGPRGEPIGSGLGGEGGVGVVVVGGPVRGSEEGLDEGQGGGFGLDGGALGEVRGAVLFEGREGVRAGEMVVEGRG